MPQRGSPSDTDGQQQPQAAQRSAEEETAAVERQIKALDEMLTSALRRTPLTFESLMVAPAVARFDPGSLGAAPPSPNWGDFAPVRPSGLRRFFRAGRFARQESAARSRFAAAQSEYRAKESERQRALAIAKARHDEEGTQERARAARQNAEIVDQQAAFASGDAAAVEWFVGRVLEASSYPKVFPRGHRVVYRPENRDVVVEFELPPRRIVPAVRAFRYVKMRDAVEPVARQESDIKHRYQKLISCLALRTLHEIFGATPPAVVQAVVFNGRVATIDQATGKPVRPYLLSVSADRSVFDDLVLAAVEPVACLKHLNAIVSPNPFDLEEVQPFVAIDRDRPRSADAAGPDTRPGRPGPDNRPNLLKLTPAEFENLLRRLFAAMGAQTWTALPSRDGSVDAVVARKSMLFGGTCAVQARRWTGLVGLESVHALAGAMAQHDATTGVLVTTSWFGRDSEQFARRNRITLINGAELRQLIREHLNQDVIPGTSPPQRLQPSPIRPAAPGGPGAAPDRPPR
jgi:restriction system protein